MLPPLLVIADVVLADAQALDCGTELERRWQRFYQMRLQSMNVPAWYDDPAYFWASRPRKDRGHV
jgi:hypothetical protein